jgi:NAD+ synthase (glutamine-hydrolysing)
LVAGRARDNKVVVAYVNQVGGQDELVFDGGSLIADARGLIAAQSPFFVDDLLVVDISNDGSVSPVVTADDAEDDELARVYDALVLGTRDYVRKNGFTDVVLGLSGGIDSALVAAVAVDALGAEHVHGVSMPSRYSSEGSITDATTLATNLGIDLRLIPIEPAFGAYLDMLAESFAGKPADLTEENLQSRVRGTVVMALSNKHGWMVLTTGNKSEMAVGYCTLYGDMCGGLAVISDVFKMQVYALARWINREREIIPVSTIEKPPSAELRPDQTDQDSLPPYDVLDAILKGYVEEGLSRRDLVAQGFAAAVVNDVIRKVDLNEYKRKQAAPGLKITPLAFGVGRRIPIVQKYVS